MPSSRIPTTSSGASPSSCASRLCRWRVKRASSLRPWPAPSAATSSTRAPASPTAGAPWSSRPRASSTRLSSRSWCARRPGCPTPGGARLWGSWGPRRPPPTGGSHTIRGPSTGGARSLTCLVLVGGDLAATITSRLLMSDVAHTTFRRRIL